jgi:light-regulated signal transduction histidine kinase (bacteriophytochrome)/HAMP domain-containing protein
LRRDLGFLAAIAALAFVATWFVSGWLIVRPIQRLVAVTGRLASGDLRARTNMRGGGELNDLAESVDEMAEALLMRNNEQRQAREELLNFNQTLEERVRTRTAELQRRNAELDEFTYVVSHDLKEPLRGIAGFNALLLEDFGDQLDDEGKRYIGIINDSTVRMKRLIDDLLELSRVGRVSGPLREVSVQDLADEVLADSRYSLDEKGGEVTTSFATATITADVTRLKQVLKNLVSNAIKYGDKTSPKIRLSCEEQNGVLLFSVADNGEGIDPRYQEKIFGVFQRLEGRNDAEGTGVGLAICRKIVQSWGGRIWVESELGTGATFKFTMPLVQGEEQDDDRAA